MYEAEQFTNQINSGLFGFDDLPNEINFKLEGYGQGTEIISLLLPKATEPNQLYFLEIDDPFTPTFGADPKAKFIIEDADGIWGSLIVPSDVDPFQNALFCLGERNVSLRDDLTYYITEISDNFPSSFSVSGPQSGIATRPEKWTKTTEQTVQELYDWVNGLAPYPSMPKTICRWTGANLVLRWNFEICKWQVNGNTKTGLQNTPVGSYEGGYTVS
jgi:hypothetical protein